MDEIFRSGRAAAYIRGKLARVGLVSFVLSAFRAALLSINNIPLFHEQDLPERDHEIGAVTEDVQMKLPGIIQNESTSYVEGIVRHKGELVTAIHHESILTPNEAAQLSVAMKSLLKKKQDEQDAILAAEAARKEAEEKMKAEAKEE